MVAGIMTGKRKTTSDAKGRSVLSVPLSLAQREELERRAGAEALSAYARGCLFPANDNAPAKRERVPMKDRTALAAVLARLGASEIAPNLREIARLARLGALPLTPETEAAIQQACLDVAEIKALLMRALSIKED